MATALGPTVTGVTFTWSADNSFAIETNYGGAPVAGGAVLTSNTFNNNKTTSCSMVGCRDELQGTSVIIGHAEETTVPADLESNQCFGGPQGCMMVDALNSTFNNNGQVNPGAPGTSLSNDFAIYAWACGQQVTNNKIGTNPPTGNQATRGISIDEVEFGSGSPGCAGTYNVSSNFVSVIANNHNAEYSGCAPTGTYGIQVDDGGENANIQLNTVNAFSNVCPSIALRITELGDGIVSGGTGLENTYSAHLMAGASVTPGGDTPVAAVAFDSSSSGEPFNSIGDTFLGDGESVYVDSDGCGPAYFDSPTLGSGTNATNYYTFYFYNNSGGSGAACTQLYFSDPTFTGSASETSTFMQVGNNAPYDLAKYFIQYTYSGQVKGAVSGSPIIGASASVVGHTGTTECTTTTDSGGNFSCTGPGFPGALGKLDMSNSATATLINTTHNPHTLTITKSGCTTFTNSSLNITAKSTGNAITLGGC